MLNTRTLAAAAILVGVGIAGCGDDDARTHEAFVEEVDRVCDGHIESRDEIAAEHFSDEEPPTVDELQSFYADFAPVYVKTVDGLEEIEADDEHASDYADYVTLRRRNAETLTEAAADTSVTQRMLDTDEAELHEGEEELVSELGINPEC